jgi:hypothetical protein
MFELHLLSALANGFKYYSNNKPAFKTLFFGFADSTLEAWFSLLNANLPTFYSRYAQGTRDTNTIMVLGGIENVTDKFTGKMLTRASNGLLEVGYNVNEDAQVVLFTKSPELARVYHSILRASFEQGALALQKAGYYAVTYEGSQALSPEEELASEEMWVYVKKLNFSCSYTVSIQLTKEAEFGDLPIITNAAEVLVLASDQEKNGNKGGVTPQT